jgi:hypothetical protein
MAAMYLRWLGTVHVMGSSMGLLNIAPIEAPVLDLVVEPTSM